MSDLLKNQIDQKFTEELADQMKKAYSRFDQKAFLDSLKQSKINTLALKARARAVSHALHAGMSELPLPNQIDLIVKIAPFFQARLAGMVFPDYIEVYGLPHFDHSMRALAKVTSSFSSEFAVRVFLKHDFKRAYAYFLKWCQSKDHHQRRLASEGLRPRLPWSFPLPMIISNPKLSLPILKALKRDPEKYVQKSVANHLNDLTKDHPELVLDLAKSWMNQHEHTDWIIRHALRSELKKGTPAALKLFSVSDPSHLELDQFKLSAHQIKMGEILEFQFKLHVKKSKKARLEYRVHFIDSQGNLTRSKVFQISEKHYDKGSLSFQKKHAFKPLSTRKLYPGTHRLEVILNGKTMAGKTFELKAK